MLIILFIISIYQESKSEFLPGWWSNEKWSLLYFVLLSSDLLISTILLMSPVG